MTESVNPQPTVPPPPAKKPSRLKRILGITGASLAGLMTLGTVIGAVSPAEAEDVPAATAPAVPAPDPTPTPTPPPAPEPPATEPPTAPAPPASRWTASEQGFINEVRQHWMFQIADFSDQELVDLFDSTKTFIGYGFTSTEIAELIADLYDLPSSVANQMMSVLYTAAHNNM